MKKRICSVLAVVAVMLALEVGPAFAAENSGNSNAINAPGQANARANCVDTGTDQGGPPPGNGAKSTYNPPGPGVNTAQTNCDHFWQDAGVIGNQH